MRTLKGAGGRLAHREGDAPPFSGCAGIASCARDCGCTGLQVPAFETLALGWWPLLDHAE